MKVFEKAIALIDYTIIMTDSKSRYPKKARFTFVDRMQNMTLDIYKKLSKANEIPTVNRREVQIDVLSDLNVFLAMIELSHKNHYIDARTMSIWVGKTMDVKHLTAAWMRSN